MTKAGFSWRAFSLGLILSAVAVFTVAWAELVIGEIQIAILQFAPAAVGLLIVVIGANLVLRNLSRRLALRPPEIILIYAMVLVASLATGRGVLEKWIPTLVCYNYFATPANHWAELLFPHTPQWAVPFDVEGGAAQYVARAFYEGLPLGQALPWQAWVTPLAAWSVVIILVLASYLCLAAILRRQWIDNEKLSFPLTILPLELAQDRPGPQSFFRNKLVLVGFLIPTFIYLCNGLHANYPGFPHFKLQYDLGPSFQALGRPWNEAANWTYMYFSMGAIGFFYFLPTELLFTMWFFFWFARMENVLFSAFGVPWEGMGGYPTAVWNGYQTAGAFMVLVGYMIKSAWPYLRQVWQATLAPALQAERELLPLRLAVVGLVVATLGSIIWFWKLGMSPAVAVLNVVIFLFVTIPVMARSVNEVGLLETETSFRPVDLIRMVMPIQKLSRRTMTALSLTDAVFMRDQRGNLLSAFLDSLKMADVVKLDRRTLMVALVAALVVALILGGALHIILPYKIGAIQMYTYVYQGTPRWMASGAALDMLALPKYDSRLPFFFLSGVLITLGLTILRTRYLWWPLAPIGMALSGTWGIIVFWFPLLVAWIIKGTVLRYGGMRAFMALRPFFLGLILGEFFQAVVWAALSNIWRLEAPFFPLG